jgi:hypothetical protein
MPEPLDETPKAHAAFLAYCELGITRSLAKLAEHLGKPAAYVRQLEYWSSQFNWQARVKGYDEERAAERRKVDGELVRRVLLKHLLATVEPNANSQMRAAALLLQQAELAEEIKAIKEQQTLLDETLRAMGVNPLTGSKERS